MQPGVRPRPFRQRLRLDPAFYLELGYCVDHGLPHSVFLGWDPLDRAKVVALLQERSQRCQMCGTSPWEWDPNQGGDPRAYETIEVTCPGCSAKDQAAALVPERAPGMTIELAPTIGHEADLRLAAAERAYRQDRAERRSSGDADGQRVR